MSRLPAALFIVDIKAEHIAVKEAQKLNIPVFAMVDTNSDPRQVEYVIPANDDASKSIDKILSLVTGAIIEGLSERGSEKDGEGATDENVEEVVTAAVPAATPVVEAPVAEAPVAEESATTEE
jgi:small subunit ribosomal protein S2